MAIQLAEELKALGCNTTPDRFREIVRSLLVIMFPGWTDEELLTRPYDALRYCQVVRARTSDGVPDNLILRTLSNTRKRQRRKETTDDS